MKFCSLLLLLLALSSQGQAPLRQTITLSENWKFTKGNPSGAETPDYDTRHWQTVRVPHDWAIAGPFDPAGSAETGKLPWQGQGWYRNTFRVEPDWADKRVYVLFDGVMAFPKVYANGRYAGEWDYGYNSFFLDITHLLRPGTDNVLAVYADTRRHDSRWYPGAGIYRKVQLIVTDPVHVDIWGTHITTPEITPEQATVQVRTSVRNEGDHPETVSVQQYILSDGGEILAADSVGCPIKTGEAHVFEQRLRLPNARLWSPETPVLYTLKTVLRKGGAVCDDYISTFGVRTIEFTANNGMLLNGKRLQLKGVNQHHDFGALGAAFNKRAQERQLELLRSMGCNAIRTSHNAPAPELLDLCDRMGFLVLDELFDKYDGKADYQTGADFATFAERQVRNFVERDRNHPCIFLWSAGNEIGDVQGNMNGGFAKMQAVVQAFRRYDPERAVTLVCDNRDAAALRHFDYYDVVSYNYGRRYALARQLAPHKAVIITESASTVSTRGFYQLPLPAKKTDFTDAVQVSSYDLNTPSWAEVPEDDFRWQQEDPFVAGEFVWTGFDYLGEPTPYGDYAIAERGMKREDLARSSYFGILDLTGLPKDRFFLYKSVWKPEETTVHILPHWNWPERTGQPVPVFVYTNGDCAELFLNGKSLGKQCKQTNAENSVERYRLMWNNVPYTPGTLRAVAYHSGQRIGEAEMKTTSQPATIRLTADRSVLHADGDDLCFVTVEILDREGNQCPLAENSIRFQVGGPAEIAAVDNGNPRSYAPFQSDTVQVFFGKAMLVLRTKKGQPGNVTVTATGEGLKSGQTRARVE
ncbi:MAG: glycoside hydrolase family 2 TIM barrel-domain containing protein [Saprospiraceae bacterium]